MNIIYHSGWLDIVMAAGGAQTLPIKVDDQNLGRISVLLGQDWTTIPGPRELEGVSLEEWLSRNDELARRHGEQARLDFASYIAPALIDIEREAKRAEEYFQLKDVGWTADRIDQIERDLRVFVLYDRDPQGDELGLTKDSSQLGSVHVRSIPVASTAPAALTGHTTDEPSIASEAGAPMSPMAPMKRNRPKKDRP